MEVIENFLTEYKDVIDIGSSIASILITSLLFLIGYIGIFRKFGFEEKKVFIPFYASYKCCKKVWGKGSAIVLLVFGIIDFLIEIGNIVFSHIELPFVIESSLLLIVIGAILFYVIRLASTFYLVWKIIYIVKLGKVFYKKGGLIFLLVAFHPIMLVVTGYNKTKVIKETKKAAK